MNYYVWNSLKTKLLVVEAPYKGTIYITNSMCNIAILKCVKTINNNGKVTM